MSASILSTRCERLPLGTDPEVQSGDVETRVRAVDDGILADDLYIFTHPEFRSMVTERHERLLSGFDRAEAFSG